MGLTGASINAFFFGLCFDLQFKAVFTHVLVRFHTIYDQNLTCIVFIFNNSDNELETVQFFT